MTKSFYPFLNQFLKELGTDPYSELNKFQKELDLVFNDVFGNCSAPNFSNLTGTYPKINVLEKKNSYELIAATPGLSKEDISVQYKKGILTLKATSKQDPLEKGVSYLCRELKKSNFIRSVQFDTSKVDEKNISSSYVNGELRVTILKREKKEEESININIS